MTTNRYTVRLLPIYVTREDNEWDTLEKAETRLWLYALDYYGADFWSVKPYLTVTHLYAPRRDSMLHGKDGAQFYERSESFSSVDSGVDTGTQGSR